MKGARTADGQAIPRGERSRDRLIYRVAKRAMDIGISLLALTLLSPLFLVTILALRFTGEREVFYRQERVGYRNRRFQILKFATMLKNSPNMGTGEITVRNDPRVTKVGRWLRITKINELPQLLNVLKGDMSIVGPRPLMPVSFSKYPETVQKVIYQSVPGITGIGSIVFRDEEDLVSRTGDPHATYRLIYEHKGELEMWYQDHASIVLDLAIVFVTAWVVVFPTSKLLFRLFPGLPARNF